LDATESHQTVVESDDELHPDNFVALQQQWERESDDPMSSEAQRAELTSLFEELQLPNELIRDIRCRPSVCRIAVSEQSASAGRPRVARTGGRRSGVVSYARRPSVRLRAEQLTLKRSGASAQVITERPALVSKGIQDFAYIIDAMPHASHQLLASALINRAVPDGDASTQRSAPLIVISAR